MQWRDLEEELDRWKDQGIRATFWWRDDDGGALTPAMERTLLIAERSGVAPGMAVIPGDAVPSLAEAIGDNPLIAVFQHGCRHYNHRRTNGKASEFPSHRDPRSITRDLTLGWNKLLELFPERLDPVLVPPWGHIAGEMVAVLPGLGYQGLSRFDPRATPGTPGLMEVNAHCDVIKWRPEPHFRGEAKCLWHLVNHLRGRRRGSMDPDEPTGVVTHAYDLDDASFAFLKDLLQLTRGHPAAEWLAPRTVFDVSTSVAPRAGRST